LRTRLSSVPIVDSSSLLPLENKNSTHLVVSRTSRSAVPIAAGLGRPNALGRVVWVVIERRVKCTASSAPSAAPKPKYRSNPVVTDRSIAAIATAKPEPTGNVTLS